MAELAFQAETEKPRRFAISAGMAGLTSRQPTVVECRVTSWWTWGRDGFMATQGARLIDSTPPAMTMSASPVAISRLAQATASRPDPHSLFTVRAGTPTGRPALRAT